jgi:altronate dehydratase
MDIHIEIGSRDGLEDLGRLIFDDILEVASGKKTKAEVLGYGNFPDIWVPGTTF